MFVCMCVWSAVQENSERLSGVHALLPILFDFYFFRLLLAAFTSSESGSRRQNCTCIKIKPWTKCVRQTRQQSWKCDCDRVTHSYEYKLFIYDALFRFGFSAVWLIYCWAFDRTTRQRIHIDPKDGAAHNITIKTPSQRKSIELIFRDYFIGDELVRV